jgi:hypothetical protein
MRSIVGTWRLVVAAAHDGNGQPLPPPYGGKGMGRVAFTADGRMMSVVCDGRPELPFGVHRDYSSYCGNYTFDGRGWSPRSTPRRIRPASAASRCATSDLTGIG